MNYQQIQIQYYMKMLQYDESEKQIIKYKEELSDEICLLTALPKDRIRDIRVDSDRWNGEKITHFVNVTISVPYKDDSSRYGLQLRFKMNYQIGIYDLTFSVESSSILFDKENFAYLKNLDSLFNASSLYKILLAMINMNLKRDKEESELSSLADMCKNKEKEKEAYKPAPAGTLFEVTILNRTGYHYLKDSKKSSKTYQYHKREYFSDILLVEDSEKRSYGGQKVYEITKAYIVIDKYYRKKVIFSIIGGKSFFEKLNNINSVFNYNSSTECSEKYKHLNTSYEIKNDDWVNLVNTSRWHELDGSYIFIEKCTSLISEKIITNSYPVVNINMTQVIYKQYKNSQLKLDYRDKTSAKQFSASEYYRLNKMMSEEITI